MSSTEFAELVLSRVPSAQPFQPIVNYDPDGDCIEFLASDESYYAERVDSLVTVYYGRESKEIVGSLIKGVKRFLREVLEKTPGFKIEIQDGRVKLEYLFTVRLWSEVQPAETLVCTYKKLRRAAEQAGAEAEVGDLAAA